MLTDRFTALNSPASVDIECPTSAFSYPQETEADVNRKHQPKHQTDADFVLISVAHSHHCTHQSVSLVESLGSLLVDTTEARGAKIQSMAMPRCEVARNRQR